MLENNRINKKSLFNSNYGNIQYIRNRILNTIYLFSGIIGTMAVYSTIVRALKFGWQTNFIYNFIIYIAIWLVYLFRKRISFHKKSIIFFTLFFILASFINIFNGLISGSIAFVMISTLLTLLYGWRTGIIAVILTLIVRTIIGILYFKGILTYSYNLQAFATSFAAMLISLISALVISLILVFAINEFYRWLIASLNDISKKAEELEQKNNELLVAKQKAEENDRLKSVFLANMSHEIRTPMNAIVGFSGILSKPNLSEEKRNKYAIFIQERSYDLMRIIEDILDISKIEVGQLNFLNSEFELKSLLVEILEYYSLKKKRIQKEDIIEIKCIIDDNQPELKIYQDKHRIKQIFTNLIDNAFKFTDNGTIEFGFKLNDNNTILLWVKDTGIGIAKEKQDIIFDRFRQADDLNINNRYGGTGLGLSIVKGIITLMQGKIWVESENGAGSVFFFTLPVRAQEKL